MRIYALKSGSKANSTLVQTTFHSILIDVGGSMKSLEQDLMMSEGITLDDISLILITHSHFDHIQSVRSILNKYKDVKVYCSPTTYEEINAHFKVTLDEQRFILSTVKTEGRNIDITPFELNHDKVSQGYLIEDKFTGEDYCHLSDNGGWLDKDLFTLLHNKKHYSIESNHSILEQYFTTKRDNVLKRRCLSYTGHASNLQAIEMATKLVGDRTETVIFNHLSEDTNSVELATKTHMAYLEVWSKLEEWKHIKISYALQNSIVPSDTGKTHKQIRGVR